MTIQSDQIGRSPYDLWGNLWQILDISQKRLVDYEKIQENFDLTKLLPQIESAYMDSIIVHVAKIFSTSKNEAFRLQQFKIVCREEIKQEFEQVEEKYKDIIKKVITNRDQIVAHLDKNFSDLVFSTNEIEAIKNDMVSGLRISPEAAEVVCKNFNRTCSKSDERYSIRDFRGDFTEIKGMINFLLDIWRRSIPLLDQTNN